MNQTQPVSTQDELQTRRMPGRSSNFATDCIVICLATITAWTFIPHAWLIGWTVFAALFTLAREFLRRLYLRQDDAQRNRWLGAWQQFIPAANVSWGLVWVGFLLLTFARLDLGTQFLVTMIIMGMSMTAALHGGTGAKWQVRLLMGSASLCWLVWGQPFSIQMAVLGTLFILVMEKVNAQQSAVVRQKAEMVSRMKALVTDLDTRNTELAAVSQAKTQLLATASHDVRQPIHAILMALDDWTPDLPPAEHGERITVVRTRIAAMSDMLQGLLDLSRLDLGVFKLNVERTDLGAFLRSQAAGHMAAMRRKGLDFVVDTREVDGLMVNTDAGLLARMVSNLLTNAYKYTWEGSVLLKGSRTTDGGMAIAVVDTGIGIPNTERHHIFQEYVRLTDRHESTDGVGIGLAVVSKGAALLGYEVDVTSGSGKGSTFTLTLPASSLAWELMPANTERTALPSMRILLVEDDADAAAWTSRVLRRAGHDVRSATDLMEALRVTGPDFMPQVVVSDFQLASSSNGVEAIAELRAHLNDPRLPALLLTGDLTVQVRELARRADVNVLHKPLRPAQLLEAIRGVTLGVVGAPAAAA